MPKLHTFHAGSKCNASEINENFEVIDDTMTKSDNMLAEEMGKISNRLAAVEDFMKVSRGETFQHMHLEFADG